MLQINRLTKKYPDFISFSERTAEKYAQIQIFRILEIF
jgi:hypothetical protein